MQDIDHPLSRRAAPGITDVPGGAEQPGRVAVHSRQNPGRLPDTRWRVNPYWIFLHKGQRYTQEHGKHVKTEGAQETASGFDAAEQIRWRFFGMLALRIGRGGGDQAKPLSVPEIIDGFSGNSLPFRLQPLVQVPFLRRGEHTDHLLSAISGSGSPCFGRPATG